MSASDSTYLVPSGDGSNLLERVLLAFIEAHSTPATSGSQKRRLETALAALLGSASPAQRNMEAAHAFMVRQRRHAICEAEFSALSTYGEIPPAIPTIVELTENAAQRILQCKGTDLPAAVGELCKWFRRYATRTAIESDSICQALKSEAVGRICNERAEWDIATSRSGRRQSTAV